MVKSKSIKHYTEKDVSMLGFHSSMILLDIEDVLRLIEKMQQEGCSEVIDAEELKMRIKNKH